MAAWTLSGPAAAAASHTDPAAHGGHFQTSSPWETHHQDRTAAEGSSTQVMRAPLGARDTPAALPALGWTHPYFFIHLPIWRVGGPPSALPCRETISNPHGAPGGTLWAPYLPWAAARRGRSHPRGWGETRRRRAPQRAANGGRPNPANGDRAAWGGGGDPISSLAPGWVHLLYPSRGGGVAGLRSEARQQKQPHSGISFRLPHRGAVPRPMPARKPLHLPAARARPRGTRAALRAHTCIGPAQRGAPREPAEPPQ